MSNIRPIISTGCFCKFCAKQIPKGENAYVFTSRFAGQRQRVHLHLDCLRNMQEEAFAWKYNQSIEELEK